MKLYAIISDNRMVIKYSIGEELVTKKNAEIANDTNNILGLNHL